MRPWVALAVVLLVLWVIAWLFLKVAGALIHLVLLAAIVLVAVALMRKGARSIRSPRR